MATNQFAPDEDAAVFVISVAAELAGMHAQTLRQYDRLGLVRPRRTRGGGRRYSSRDIETLREIQRMSQEEGISLTGIARIFDLKAEVDELRDRVSQLADDLARARVPEPGTRVFSVAPTGETLTGKLGERPRVVGSQAVVVWRPRQASQ